MLVVNRVKDHEPISRRAAAADRRRSCVVSPPEAATDEFHLETSIVNNLTTQLIACAATLAHSHRTTTPNLTSDKIRRNPLDVSHLSAR